MVNQNQENQKQMSLMKKMMKKYKNMIRKNPKRKKAGSGSLKDETKNKKFTHFSRINSKGVCRINR
jgi:hypothetical protein